MGYNVGMPVIKLNNLPHFSEKSKKNSGNAKAVVTEGLMERMSSDEDLKRDLTPDNHYYAFDDMLFTSGEELYNYWNGMAESYKVVDKNGKEKKLRSDASIGFAGICKPEKAFMDTLSRDEQQRFFDDSMDVIEKIYKGRGMTLDAAVIHYDEGNPHIHYYGHDAGYKLGKKIDLLLYKALNVEYPTLMQEKGWDINKLVGYDVDATKNMTPDELAEYKANFRKTKTKGGKSSKVYKAEQEAKSILDNAQSNYDSVMKRARSLAKDNMQLKSRNDKLSSEFDEREINIKKRESSLTTRELLLDAEKRRFEDEKQAYKDNLRVEYENLLKQRISAYKQRLDERDKERQSKFETAMVEVNTLAKDISSYKDERANTLNKRLANVNSKFNFSNQHSDAYYEF